MRNKELYNETHQSRSVPPTAYESLLGDSIERAYAQGLHDLDGLVAFLNASGPSGPDAQPWTAELYRAEIARMAV